MGSVCGICGGLEIHRWDTLHSKVFNRPTLPRYSGSKTSGKYFAACARASCVVDGFVRVLLPRYT
ncbi:hypothetical protein PHMEG_00016017 [Phytophthora megakarya]|uniref:Uncharacterized protein n=1 Tax=Phytophthora megakarya TaxID=4795 RepID=A0A225W1G5_9STRA|nr:hypothetical protein PHMEG_00016017 [Phytophthora megakarya]